MLSPTDFPNDIDARQAMLIAAEARDQRKQERIDRLELLVAAFKQAMFGRKSEKIDPDQFELALEDIETAIAAIHAEDDAVDPAKTRPAKPQKPAWPSAKTSQRRRSLTSKPGSPTTAHAYPPNPPWARR